MKFPLYAAIMIIVSSCYAGTKSQVQTAASPTELGLNDVAIILPYRTLPGLMEQAPSAFDKPDPARFAPEQEALPVDGESFVPTSILHEISKILLEDEVVHKQEGFAFGSIGDPSFEADVTLPGAVNSGSPYRFVSMRIDACANELHINGDLSRCERNIRLVFQPLFLDQGKVTAKDNNVHAIYQPDEQTFASFVNGIRALRENAGPAPRDEALALHPVIAKEGVDGAYFQGLVRLMHRYLRASSLKRIAFFGDTNPSELGHWPMVAFNVKNLQIVRVPLDKLEFQPGEQAKFVQRIGGVPFGFLQDPLPRGQMEPSLFPIATPPEDPAEMENFVKDFMSQKHKASLLVENPDKHDPSTADCATCHMAVSTRFGVESEMRSMGMEISYEAAFQSQSFNLKSAVTADMSRQALQIFSYFKTEEKIAPRAIHDAAVSADFLNHH